MFALRLVAKKDFRWYALSTMQRDKEPKRLCTMKVLRSSFIWEGRKLNERGEEMDIES